MRRAALLSVCCGVAWTVGCEGLSGTVKPEPAPPPKSSQADDPLVAGTVAAETIITNVDVQPLRGFGLVVGLDGRGSSDCPAAIRDYLVEQLAKALSAQGQGGPTAAGRKAPSAGDLIDSLDTAVVEVTGYVEVGAREGARFDLAVTAVPGSSTQSLEGGVLVATPMRYFDRSASGAGMFAGAILAHASGPVFVDPFVPAPEGGPDTNARRGRVLGGGQAGEERPTRLTLLRPNYQLTQRIERRINERFGHKPKVAEAMSAGYLLLHTPPKYARRTALFHALVGQLLIDNRPPLVEQRLRELSERVVRADVDRERIAQTWEAAGPVALPHIRPFYVHEDASVRFHAARTGVRLGDLSAIPVLAGVAATPGDPRRNVAIRELGDCESPQAAEYLLPLLNDADDVVRISTYEALLKRGEPRIRSTTFRHIRDASQINFVLDVVESDGAPLIHVRRTRLPRIAVFGSRMSVQPPVFYAPPDDSVLVHTVSGADDLRLHAKRGNRISEEIIVPPRVVELISALAELPRRDESGRLRGLGLPYSRVLAILAALSKDGTIAAPLVFEQGRLVESLRPDEIPERPEAKPSDEES